MVSETCPGTCRQPASLYSMPEIPKKIKIKQENKGYTKLPAIFQSIAPSRKETHLNIEALIYGKEKQRSNGLLTGVI